jgi:hypothetical protein
VVLGSLLGPQTGPASLVAHIVVAVAVSVAVLVALHRTLGSRGRRALTVVVTFFAGLFFGLEYFLPATTRTLWPTGVPNATGRPGNLLSPGIEPATTWLMVIGAFTVGLGVYSLVQVHGRNIIRGRPGWYNSLAFFISLLAMLAFGFWQYSLHLPEPLPAHLTLMQRLGDGGWEFLFQGLYAPLSAATFSLLAFYIASAAYRAFRIRTVDAALMMLAAFVVMLGQVPIGRWLTNWVPNVPPISLLRLENLGEWVMRWWNSPAQRAIALGVAVGALAMSLRIWLSLERGTFFSESVSGEEPEEPNHAGSVAER